LHAEAPSYLETDWNEIIGLYELLLQVNPSPIVELNCAVALAMRDGPAAGLERVFAIRARGDLQNYYLLYAACADFHCKLGQRELAKAAYEQALSLTQQEPEQRFLRIKIAELSN